MLPLRGCGNFLEKVTGDKCLKVFHIVTNDRAAIVTIPDMVSVTTAQCRAREAPACLGMGNLVLITKIGIVNWGDGLVVLLSKS